MIERKHQAGITLLEMLLVFAIMAGAFMFGYRVLSQFQFQAREAELNAKVNQLFKAVEGFYYANCRRALDTDGSPQSKGRLDPAVTDSSQIAPTVFLSVTDDLFKPGYLSSWQPNSPLLDNKGTDQGYFVQFNRVISNGRDPVAGVVACTGDAYPPSCNKKERMALDNPATRGDAVTWVVQVGVKLSEKFTPAQWKQIKNDLNAQCISTTSGNGLAPCASSPTEEGYLVWTRHPSFYTENINSDYWTSEPYVREFKKQYTNDGMAARTGVTNQSPNWYNSLKYLCGG